MKDKIYIGVDIGGTKIAAGLVTRDGTVLSRNKKPTPQKAKAKIIYKTLLSVIRELIQEGNVDLSKLHGISLGVPGIVKPGLREVLVTPNIDLSDFPLAESLERDLGIRTLLGNDVNLGLLGEKWLGAGRDFSNVIGLFPGTGLGGGIIINGHLLLGAQGGAAELGHMIIDMRSKSEAAGVCGSLEALASRRAIEKAIRKAIKNKEKTIITKLLDKKNQVIKSRIIAKALKSNDAVVVRIVNDVCEVLGKACISLRHIFNPDMIIFGGGLIEACGDYMLPRIKKISDSDLLFKNIDNCRIVPSTLGDDAVILGAVALFMQEAEKKTLEMPPVYPKLNLKQHKVSVNNRVHVRNFYVRADGRCKAIGDKAVFEDAKSAKEVSFAAIKKIIKKKPDIVIVAGDKNIKLSKRAEQLLREKDISWKTFSLKEGIGFFNKYKKRKAIFIRQERTA